MKRPALLLLVASQICQADVLRYEEANFSIDVPATWNKAETPPESLALFRSPDNSKGVTFMSMKFPAKDLPTALENMVSGAKEAAQKSNVPVTGEHDKVVDGVTFRVYSMTMPGNVMVTSRMAVVGDRGYSIQAFSGAGDAATDPEVVAVLESFRLLAKTTTPPVPGAPPGNEAYEFGQMVGRWSFFALIGGAVIIMLRKAFGGSK